MTDKNNISQVLLKILEMTQSHEGMPDWALGMKLSEETGEVNEALLVANGFLQHKVLKEDVLHEVADVFNVCLGLLAKHYPTKTPEEILEQLNSALVKKGKKYAGILGVDND